MRMKLELISEDIIHEHVFERYIELGSHSEALKQDLGVFDKGRSCLEIDIEPPTIQKAKKGKKKDPIQIKDTYNFAIEQSITSLCSSKDNSNSTTGYVLWSMTPFFLKWLLYDKNAEMLRYGGEVEVINDLDCCKLNIPGLFSGQNSASILELGSGLSGITPIVLGNYVDAYICTDQRGILNKLKKNLNDNLLQLNKRKCFSETLTLRQGEDDYAGPKVMLEAILLDWEKFDVNFNLNWLVPLNSTNCIHILAMDVIYNEYLIPPFLKTLTNLISYFRSHNTEVHALIGIHLRSESVLTEFLEQAVLEYELTVYNISDPTLSSTRFGMYYI